MPSNPSSPSTRTLRERANVLLGTVVAGRYRIVDVLAMGGIGAVYRAEHIHLRRPVALKVLRPDAEGFPELQTRFEREAVAGGHLHHPNIAAATDFGKLDDGSCYLVVEFVPGKTLRALIRKGPLDPARAVHIARQIADALTACHALGIVHRDLKPRNLMVDPERGDLVKLIDFGLARVPLDELGGASPPRGELDDDEAPTLRNLTLKGIVFGTVAYMAPETALGMDAVDARSDLYALGVTLYEMLAGKHPFEPDDPTELFLCHRFTDPPPIRVRAPGTEVPEALEALVRRLMEKRPALRPQRAEEVSCALEELSGILGEGSDRAVEPRGWMRSSVPGRRSAMPTPLSTPGAFVVPYPAAPPSAAPVPGHGAPAAGPPASPPTPAPAATQPTGQGLLHRRRGRWAVAGAALAMVAGLSMWSMRDAPPATVIPPPAPVAAPAPSADPEGSDAVLEASVARSRLLTAYADEKWVAGSAALRELVELDPTRLADEEVRRAAATVGVRAAFAGGPDVEPLFDALADQAGAEGVDVLYAMVATQGGSRGAELAQRRLARPEVRAKATAALEVVLALREARCSDKEALFSRAEREGDERARLYLEQLNARACDRRRGMCCYHGHAGLERAIAALPEAARLGAP